MDLSGLVDVVYDHISPLERFTPTHVFEVNGCRVLVYVTHPTLKNSPWTTRQTYDKVHYPRNYTRRPHTSAEVEKLLNALYQVLGPSAEAEIAIWTMYAPWILTTDYRDIRVEIRNVTQLVEEARRAVEVDFYLGAADAYEAMLKKYEASKGATTQAADLHRVNWRRGDLAVTFFQYKTTSLVVETANLSAAVETLKKVRELVGEVWDSVYVIVLHVPYRVPTNETFNLALANAKWRLIEEFNTMWKSIDEKGRVRRIPWADIETAVYGIGPLYVIFHYANGTVPDKAMVEWLVYRFVELSGFCKSPLVVEIWPDFYPLPPDSPPLWPFAVAIATVAAITIGIIVFTTRRR